MMQLPRQQLIRTALASMFHNNEALQQAVEPRALLGDMLIASNTQWKETTLRLIDQVYQTDDPRVVVRHKEILPKGVSLWRGDITALDVDAVVNAANDAGLGCFQPNHRCLDNVLHRAAGPRLRAECRQRIQERDGKSLSAGTPPILTKAYNLPSQYVLHVTGPQIHGESGVTSSDRALLAAAYTNCLDAAQETGRIRSIAFPCLSTGLFGFPNEPAAEIAVSAVQAWVAEHPLHNFDAIVYNVFTDQDEQIYKKLLAQTEEAATNSNINTTAYATAKQFIGDADAVLICAGAGMSVTEGEMVYVNATDFACEYPWMLPYGYKTSYDCMGLMGDARVPETTKWAYQAKHIENQRWKFQPNHGYDTLRSLVQNKEHFILTSNVDGCFERSGFDPEHIYTPQGDWAYMQCRRACRADSVWPSRPFIDRVLPYVESGAIPHELVPTCPKCGGPAFGNVRGDRSFLHGHYDDKNFALQRWMQSMVDSGKTIAVIEVGAGFNTPTVTRFPIEAFCRDLGKRGRLIRINPDHPEVPEDLRAVALPNGWQVLERIAAVDVKHASEEAVRQHQMNSELAVPIETVREYSQYIGHFDWRRFLNQLRM